MLFRRCCWGKKKVVMIYFIYNLLFPIVFLFFLPGLIIKLIRRPGWKKTFAERFGIFSAERKAELKNFRGAVWIHSVSVGETQIALDLIKRWKQLYPGRKFVISTTTTTGQQLARDKAPEGVAVIFCPIDFIWMVKRVISLLQPSMLVVLETEIWPNMINQMAKFSGKVFLINARMSDKSSRGYYRFRLWFGNILRRFSMICLQSDIDRDRFHAVAPDAHLLVTGNLKFDRSMPEKLPAIDLEEYFGSGKFRVLLASCTHPGEEKLIASAFLTLKQDFPDLRLVLAPRHSERGGDVAAAMQELNVKFCRRTKGKDGAEPVECLIADTTGEMFSFINLAEIVIMGKSLAGHNEGHNLIEPAMFAKPIITGSVLTNFRFLLDVLKSEDALLTVAADAELEPALRRLLADPAFGTELGRRAEQAISRHRGALDRTIKLLENGN